MYLIQTILLVIGTIEDVITFFNFLYKSKKLINFK